MDFNINSLKNYFKVNTKEAAGFMLMLLTLEEGNKFKTNLGTITKLKDNKFEIETGKTQVNKLIDLWSDEEHPIDEVFNGG